MLALLAALVGIVFVILGLVHVIAVSVGLGIGLIAVLTVDLLLVVPTVSARRVP